MKKYCIDTSGLSNPLMIMPEDIFVSLWRNVRGVLESGMVAVTTEIYDEMTHIRGETGKCIVRCVAEMRLEIGNGSWDWQSYLSHVKRMHIAHKRFISEENRNRKGTIGLKDMTIIALGKTLRVPVVSMEDRLIITPGLRSRRIPNICDDEGVAHYTFNDFLRKEKIVV